MACGKVKDREIQFRLFETMARQYTPRADSLRRELLDSLRARFGERSVRECTWQHEHDLKRSGCAASSQGDGR